MESKGRFIEASIDYVTRKIRVTFEIYERVSLDGLSGTDLRIIAKKYREKRGRDANSYYWVLLSKLAEKLDTSKPALHNQMLRKYGQPLVIDDVLAKLGLPDSEEGERQIEESETFHLKPTSEIRKGADGQTYRAYIVLRGSSTYDSGEMYELIKGLISDCKEQDIETATPEELARMVSQYGPTQNRRN